MYLGERPRPIEAQPIDFVLGMHVLRPYKLWSRELSSVTKEVFWIFLHRLNVVPSPKRGRKDVTSERESIDEGDDATLSFREKHFPGLRPPVPAAPYVGGVEWDATTYIAANLDLVNGLIASLPTSKDRNELREGLKASGFEKTMGATLRTCKEKFYGGVHDGLRAWVAAAIDDDWPTQYVREGPTTEEETVIAKTALPKRNAKKIDDLPKVETAALSLDFDMGLTKGDDENAWIG